MNMVITNLLIIPIIFSFTVNSQEIDIIELDINEQLFDAYQLFEFGQCANGLTSADFNDDGFIDFATSSADLPFSHASITIFYNNQSLEFTQYCVYNFSYSYIESIDSGDYDNDGDIDLLFSYSPYIIHDGSPVKVYGVVNLLPNEGDHFGIPIMVTKRGSGIPYDPEERCNPKINSADYDGDGDLDLLVGDNSGQVEFYLNDGTANFSSAGVLNDWGLCSWGLTSADFDGDGDIDFLVAAAINDIDGYLYLVRNQLIESNGTVVFEQGPDEVIKYVYGATESLASLDYDRDGKMDFIAGNFFDLFLYQDATEIYNSFLICRIPKNSDGNFEDLTFGGLAAADFNNDGYTDFVAGGVQGVIRLFVNNHGLAAIARPYPCRLYVFDKESESPIIDQILIIGRFTVEVKPVTDLQKVEFYVGGILRKVDTSAPYNWIWRIGGSLFQKRTIRIVAFDQEGNSSSAEMKVWKII
jgi:hypothetical protein